MKMIPIDTSKRTHNPAGGKPKPPGVSINGSIFTLNNMAVIELSKLWGGVDFSLQLYVSECGDYVGFGARKSVNVTTGFKKTVTSGEARERLNLPRTLSRFQVSLKLEKDILIGKVN